jgi:hypothetical protein
MNFFSIWSVDATISRSIARQKRAGWATVLAVCCAIFISAGTLGCGMAASPQPPSLQLPKPVGDLKASRVGDQVSLQWNTPSETTDRLKLRGPVQLVICRQLGTGPCQRVATVFSEPDKPASYNDSLPSVLTTGPLHAITYEIIGINKHGRSAGPSNAAEALAGEAPRPVENLSATMVERGVVLRWQAIANLQPDTSVQLQRTLSMIPVRSNNNTTSGLPPVAEPTEQTLRVTPDTDLTDPGKALNTNVGFNRNYRYVAARVTRLKVGTQWLQVASSPSVPVNIFTRDTFPPATPASLTAVPIAAAMNGGQPEVDLSWSANTEPDIAQYLIYRRNVDTEVSARQSAPEQIAPGNSATPIVAPAFRDLHVQPGHTYAYSVVAVDNAGNKSPGSLEVVATVPKS